MNVCRPKEAEGKAAGGVAILFVHGILGNREFFDFLLPYVPRGWTQRSLLLEGHGGTALDFAGASMARWREQVHEAVAELRSCHGRVLVAAHSMGTLFAIREAVDGGADAVFLLNPPLRLRLSARLLVTPLKIFTGRVSPDDVWTQAAIKACGVEIDRNLLHYVGWIPRYIELFVEIWRTRKLCHRLECRTEVFFSAHDEMVSSRGRRYLEENHRAEFNSLPTSGHYYYSDSDRAAIISRFKQFTAV